MFGAKLNFESRFFVDLNGNVLDDLGVYEMSGVDVVSMSYNNQYSIQKILGKPRGVTMPNGPISQTLTIGRNLIYDDLLLTFTGDRSIAGHLYYNDSYYGFNKGYLRSYSVNCAVGSVPRVQTDFQIFDYLTGSDPSYNIQNLEDHPIIDIPSQGSIQISCDNTETNRVVGFDYNISINRKAHYAACGHDVEIESIPPLEYSANVTIDVDDAFLDGAKSFFEERENKTVSLSINGRNGNQIQSVNIPNASLVSEKIDATAEGELKMTLTYIGHG